MLLWGRRTDRHSPHRRAEVLREPSEVDWPRVRKLVVEAPSTRLPEVAQLVREARRRRRLGGLLVGQDQSFDGISRQLRDLDLLHLGRRIIYRRDEVAERVVQAWELGAQEHLVADADLVGETLLVTTCAFAKLEVPAGAVPALRRLSPDQLQSLSIAADGAYLHWPAADLHLDLEALRMAVDPRLAERARAERLAHDQRFGQAVAAVRRRHGLGQADIPGVSDRQVRRIEHGARPRLSTIATLAAAHRQNVEAYLAELAEVMVPLG